MIPLRLDVYFHTASVNKLLTATWVWSF